MSEKKLTIKEQITWNRLADTFDPGLLDADSFVVESIYEKDYPDFSDAYVSYAEFKGGIPLTDEEMDILHWECSELIYEAVLDEVYR